MDYMLSFAKSLKHKVLTPPKVNNHVEEVTEITVENNNDNLYF